jgi:hypothetical protein
MMSSHRNGFDPEQGGTLFQRCSGNSARKALKNNDVPLVPVLAGV